jgi:ketopantoate hydroxymethyltransferase
MADGSGIQDAIERYVTAVKGGEFPAAEHVFS